MEIESKFLVLGETDIQELETLSQLGEYSISKAAAATTERDRTRRTVVDHQESGWV
jgi:inorganic triphosphatase YgiF